MRYTDRVDAGRTLGPVVAERLAELPSAGSNPLVLGIPRGGVVVAREVATAVSGELGLALARKVGAPGNPELAIGAIGEYGEPIIDHDLVERLGVTDDYLVARVALERQELERRSRMYRGEGPAPQVAERAVIVVDDGIATGATLQAVLDGIRGADPALLVCAVPVGAPDSVARISGHADLMICPSQPRWFRAVGEWYENFEQTTDREVLAILDVSG